jgi:hypothetical protein
MRNLRFPYLSSIVLLLMFRFFLPLFILETLDLPSAVEINEKTGKWLTISLIIIGFFIVRKINKSSYNELLESPKSKKTSIVFVIVCLFLGSYYFAFSFWTWDGKGFFTYRLFFVIPTIIALIIVEMSITSKPKSVKSKKVSSVDDIKTNSVSV